MSRGRYTCRACGCDHHDGCVNLVCVVGWHNCAARGEDVGDAPEPPLFEGPTVVDADVAPSEPVEPGTNRRQSWEQFREAGMLWSINRVLHLFGWAIVVSIDDGTGETVGAFPVRTEWRGFDRESEERGYRRVTEWMRRAADSVAEETSR